MGSLENLNCKGIADRTLAFQVPKIVLNWYEALVFIPLFGQAIPIRKFVIRKRNEVLC